MDDFLKKYKPFSRECFDHVRSLSEYTAEQEQKKKMQETGVTNIFMTIN